ncbi:MAG TPA: hypothetical protein VHS09_01675 [Polyangiaceae bacterium]|nr:hypothetical protein [Polyangiaceae bacterium]
MRLAPTLVVLAAAVTACSTLTEDPAAQYDANPLGTGLRIHDVQDPSSPLYSPNKNVIVSSTVVSWIDKFDETKDGKSVGTVYIQDVGSAAPFSGIDVYEPSFVPASLRLLPGDVLDFNGPYQEILNVGSAVFNPPDTLPQLAKPVGTYRYDFMTPTPVVIQLSDIDQTNYATGRKWENMLVTLEDITVGPGVNSSNRVSYIMGQGDAAVDANAAGISNELYDLGASDYPGGTHFTSVTGIVTWFYSFNVAPRSADDLKQ